MRPAQNSSRSRSEFGGAQRRGAAAARDAGDLFDQVIDLGDRTVELDDQNGVDVERIARMDEFLDRMDRRLVHHLHAAGDDAGGDDAADAGAGFFDGGKADQHGAGAFGLAQNPHRDLGDDAEQPLGADHDAEQIVAGAHRDACRRAA